MENDFTVQKPLVNEQKWKVRIAVCSIILFIIFSIFRENLEVLLRKDLFVSYLIFSCVSLCIFLISMLSVRCSSCRLVLTSYAMKKQPANLWLDWLFNVTHCPKCNHSTSNKLKKN